MLVAADACRGTIGGGHLEYQAIAIAREMLATLPPPRSPRLERFPLGARSGQCCGGLVHLSFEHLPAERPAWIARLLTLGRSRRVALVVTRLEAPSISSGPASHRSARTARGEADEVHSHKRVVTLPQDDDAEGGGEIDSARRPAHRAERASPRDGWHRAEVRAREMLRDPVSLATRWEPPFLYEPFLPNDFDIRLFGAGHVGRAVVDVLHPLPCTITWIDSRPSAFPAAIPDNVQVLQSDRPEDEVDDAPPGSHLIVMTHSHALDQAICERALRRADIAWCGLIGSSAKRRRFEQRLLARGLGANDLARLVCPIGVRGITGKHPAEIAIAVAADILRVRERDQAAAPSAHRAA